MTIKRKWIPILAAFFFCVFLFLHFDAYEVFIFQDGALPKDYKFQLQQPFEEITMKANDGASINGLLLKTKNTPKGIILYFHGNRNNLSRWASECAYAFTNRPRSRLKLLIWDATGVWLCQRRLHRGVFHWPQAGDAVCTLSAQTWKWLIIGIEWQRLEAVQPTHWNA